MKIFFRFLFLLIIVNFSTSCDKTKIWREDYDHNDALTSSTKIVIESDIPYNYPNEDTIVQNKEIYTASSKEQLENFRKLFIYSERTGYCCCSTASYTISFYYYRNNFEYYEVDTIEFKDKVRIFENTFQYSYLIEKKNWKEFLKSL